MPEKYNRTPNTICEICGKPCYKKPNRLKTQKHITCSKKCDSISRSIWMNGKGNHQYNLKGKLNSSYKGKVEKIKNGYKFIRVEDHPFKDKCGFVREHRLIAELYLLTEENSIEINGKKYLKQDYEIHHIDENKLNNNKNNLVVLTKVEHRRIHNEKLINCIGRDEKTGRFIKINH